MSLETIGKLLDKHPSTVGYWLKKHGLTACNAVANTPKGGLEEAALRECVAAGLTLQQIADRLDRSDSTVRYWMRRYGLETVRRHRSRPVGNPKRADMECRRHGMTTFVLEGRGYYRCTRCRSEGVSKRRRRVKTILVKEAGGCCALCGYGRCQEALHFHHLDPSLKEFHLGQKGHSRSLTRSRAEVQKCILLCGNCHVEVETGLVELPEGLKTKWC
jgi:transposase